METKIGLLKALADESRMKIIQLLLSGEKCACAIVPYIGKAQPTVSRHLKVLEEAGVVVSRREGTNIWYKLKSQNAARILGVLGIRKTKFKAKC
ncbi:MAG: metalloregulator ArsR/SmtB family transcription factor [Candidatus Anstonellaceae archaeon]